MDDLRTCFRKSPRLSTKYNNYFDVYEKLLSPYRNFPTTIVEIGIADGGSLHMWRRYFGDTARIVGIDFNEACLELRNEGFDVFIGDQLDKHFLSRVFSEIQPIDILIDDGGHSNLQTLTTLSVVLEYVRDGGTIIFEDTHASYMFLYSNPSRSSFIEHARRLIDHLHARSPNTHIDCATSKWKRSIFSIEFFDSIVAFKIDRRLCADSHFVSNQSIGVIQNTSRGSASNVNPQIATLFTTLYHRHYRVAGANIKSLLMKIRELVLYVRARHDIRKIKRLDFK